MSDNDNDVHVMGAHEARAITDRIIGYLGDLEIVWGEVVDAYHRRVWVALQYESWEQWWHTELGGHKWRVPRDELDEIVSILRRGALSVRAIATVTGSSVGTVHNTITCSEMNTSNGTTDTKTKGRDGKESPAKRKRWRRRQSGSSEAEPVDLDEHAVNASSGETARADGDDSDPVAEFQNECALLEEAAKEAVAARRKPPKAPHTFSSTFDKQVTELNNYATSLQILCYKPQFVKKVAGLQRRDRAGVQCALETVDEVRDTLQDALDRIDALNDFGQPALPLGPA